MSEIAQISEQHAMQVLNVLRPGITLESLQ